CWIGKRRFESDEAVFEGGTQSVELPLYPVGRVIVRSFGPRTRAGSLPNFGARHVNHYRRGTDRSTQRGSVRPECRDDFQRSRDWKILSKHDLPTYGNPSGEDEWQAQLLIAAEALLTLAHQRRATWSVEPPGVAIAART